jgi:mRNA-degrading endonuclease RelE of RelBE toxin-antitoxin system
MTAVAYLNPNTMTITHHAKQRYLERRGWKRTPENNAAADQAIRDLLDRVCHKCPPREFRPDGRVCRRYKVGDLRLIVSDDGDTVITIYRKQKRQRTQDRSGRGPMRSARSQRRMDAW